MKVRDIGEFALIRVIQGMVEKESSAEEAPFPLVLGIGDDAAAWQSREATELATTDTLVEDVHFRHDFTSWDDLGWKAVAVNLSDIAAMGGVPLYALVTLGLRPETEVEEVRGLYRGMLSACRGYGCRIAGGDLVRSPVTFITVAMTGIASGHLLTRRDAQPGDVVAATGHLGCAAGGLRALLQGQSPEGESAKHLHKAHVRPSPRLAEGQVLVQQGVRAAMDISDGLIDDLSRMCVASGVGAVVYADQVPVDAFLRESFPQDCLSLALDGGEDYELLFAASKEVVSRVVARLAIPVSVLGTIVADHPGEVRVVDGYGAELHIDQRGWDHFR
ncbi:MAG: thiL [Dehalococcoidia bacterium]|nr:thiL [Dehalococcoidia bacterium]